MPLGTREILVAIRARDVGSRVVREFSSSLFSVGKHADYATREAAKLNQEMFNTGAKLTGLGVITAGVGLAAVSAFNNATDAAADYRKSAALTLTQVEQLGVGVSDIADIGIRVANKIPAPFDQMQAALYDIFSSMDVGTKDAEVLLNAFSKAAVAGQVDVQVAAQATIGILNAYGLEIADVHRINDVMFQLVRKGVGTYEQFNNAIGRAVPAAVGAGQSIETLAGMMAFLTRNGLSTEMAATSAARAMELFSKPDVTKSLEDLGVSVVDAQGNFRQLDDIIMDLAKSEGWATLGGPERKKLFQEVFGTGTIQARRFFDTAIPNMGQLGGLVDSMAGSSGALDDAYGIMFAEPAIQAELLKNKYAILTNEIGNELLPAKLKLMQAIMKVLDWWNNLDSGTKSIIIRFAAITAAVISVVGILTTLAGVFLMLSAMANAAHVSLVLVGGVVAAVAAGIAVLAAGIIFVSQNWDNWKKFIVLFLGPLGAAAFMLVLLVKVFGTLVSAGKTAWHAIQDGAGRAWAIMQDIWDWITGTAVAVWHTLRSTVIETWHAIRAGALTAWQILQQVWDWITNVAVAVWHTLHAAAVAAFGGIQAAASFLWTKLQEFWNWLQGTAVWEDLVEIWKTASEEAKNVARELGETFTTVKTAVIDAWNAIWGVAAPVIQFLLERQEEIRKQIVDVLIPIFNFFKSTFARIWRDIQEVVGIAVRFIQDKIDRFVSIVTTLWATFGDEIIGIISNVWEFITAITSAALPVIVTIIEVVFTGVLNFVKATLALMAASFAMVWNVIVTVATAVWNSLVNMIKTVITIISNIIQLVLNIIQGDWGEAWQNIKNIGGAAWTWLWTQLGVILNLIKGLWNSVWMAIVAIFNFTWSLIQNAFNAAAAILSAGWTFFLEALKATWNLIWGSIKTALDTAWSAIKAVFTTIGTFVTETLVGKFTTMKDGIIGAFNAVKNVMSSIWNGITGAIRSGVNAGIRVVNVLISGLNTVLGILPGLDHLKINPIKELGGSLAGATGPRTRQMAMGGTIGGGFMTNGPRAIVGEGRRAYPEYVIPTDPMYRNNALGLFQSLGGQLLAPGGILGGGIPNPLDALGDAAASIVGDIRKGAAIAAFAAPLALADQLIGRIPWEYARGVMNSFKNEVYNWVKGEDAKLPADNQGGGGGSASGLVGAAKTAFGIFRAMFPGMTIGGWRARGSVPGSDHPKGKALDLMTTSGFTAARIISVFRNMPGAKYWIWNRTFSSAASGWNTRGYNGPSPHIDHVHASFYKRGAWNLLSDQLAMLHKGEMVVPEHTANLVRSIASSASAGTTSAGTQFHFHGDVTFGADMNKAEAGLDWWARTNTAGV